MDLKKLITARPFGSACKKFTGDKGICGKNLGCLLIFSPDFMNYMPSEMEFCCVRQR